MIEPVMDHGRGICCVCADHDGTGIGSLLLTGDLGSHHSNLSEDVRGFAVADPVAPFIVINDLIRARLDPSL